MLILMNWIIILMNWDPYLLIKSSKESIVIIKFIFNPKL